MTSSCEETPDYHRKVKTVQRCSLINYVLAWNRDEYCELGVETFDVYSGSRGCGFSVYNNETAVSGERATQIMVGA